MNNIESPWSYIGSKITQGKFTNNLNFVFFCIFESSILVLDNIKESEIYSDGTKCYVF